MKPQNTQTTKQADEPTDAAHLVPQTPICVAYNRDTRDSGSQAAASRYVIAKATLIRTRSKRFATQAIKSQLTLKDFECDPDFQDVYTFSVADNTQTAAADALTQAIYSLGYTKLYVKTPVHGTANSLVLVGETPRGTEAYFVALQATTKHAIESFLNLDIQVTPYDAWSKKPLADTQSVN